MLSLAAGVQYHYMASFESMLTGGHPNSLGNTLAVVSLVLKDRTKLDELYECYFSSDEVVRLRVSNAMKRICREHPDWLLPYVDRLLDEISQINQASTQWTLAQLLLMLDQSLSDTQRTKAITVLRRNLERSNDWIVQNFTMETLTTWARNDKDLRAWLLPRLEARTGDSRKSVANRARKFRDSLLNGT